LDFFRYNQFFHYKHQPYGNKDRRIELKLTDAITSLSPFNLFNSTAHNAHLSRIDTTRSHMADYH